MEPNSCQFIHSHCAGTQKKNSSSCPGFPTNPRSQCVKRAWTHWDLNPGPSACEADVIPLHHVPLEDSEIQNYARHSYKISTSERGVDAIPGAGQEPYPPKKTANAQKPLHLKGLGGEPPTPRRANTPPKRRDGNPRNPAAEASEKNLKLSQNPCV